MVFVEAQWWPRAKSRHDFRHRPPPLWGYTRESVSHLAVITVLKNATVFAMNILTGPNEAKEVPARDETLGGNEITGIAAFPLLAPSLLVRIRRRGRSHQLRMRIAVRKNTSRLLHTIERSMTLARDLTLRREGRASRVFWNFPHPNRH